MAASVLKESRRSGMMMVRLIVLSEDEKERRLQPSGREYDSERW